MNLHVSSDVAICTNTPLVERCQARVSDTAEVEEVQEVEEVEKVNEVE
jgi:hypothetical protein